MIEKKKPVLRGYFHQIAVFVALGAGATLLAVAKDFRTAFIAFIYIFTLVGMFSFSSLYHRINWQPNTRLWLRRLDHAGIFLLIAGTGTPICLLGLQGQSGVQLLWIFWIMALIGIIKVLFWVMAPKWLSAIFFIGMGWAGAPYLREMNMALGENNMILLLMGGVIYTVGAMIYAFKKPDPFPSHFGYHEIFHLLVILASALHFMVVFNLVVRISM